MSLGGAYDPQNIFARILRGELPCHKVFEDDVALAFLDVFPQSHGHTLVLPKLAVRNLFEISPIDLAALIPRVQHVATALRSALNPDGVLVQQFNGADAGQTVFHLHVHLIPRYADAALIPHGSTGMADQGALAALAEKIRAFAAS